MIKVSSFILIMLFAALPVMAENAEFFEKIEFRGVINADKYSIIRKSGAKGNSKGILIDTDKLKEVLSDHVLLKNYNLNREGKSLIIEVEEKYPVFMTLMVTQEQSFPTLVDEKLNIIETGVFFRTDMPIIIMRKDFSETGDGYAAAASLIEMLRKLNIENKGFAAELEEISLVSRQELNVKLRKRKTLFVIKNELNGFTRLEKTAAYLDASLRYPEMLDLRGNMAFIR